MGQIDDYLTAQVTPQLGQGEQIMGLGLLRRPYRFNALGVPTHYEEWLATATSQRLILFRTEGTGIFNILTVKPKPMCQEVKQWWYQELREVSLGTVTGIGSGVSVGLTPHMPLGPYGGEGKRYDMFPAVEGLDGHGNFYSQFRGWLQQQVAAGAFPMDAQRRAAVEAHQEKLKQEAERKRLAAEERKRKALALLANWRSYVLPSIAVVLAIGAIIFAFVAYYGFRDGSRAISYAEETEQKVARSKACRAAKKTGSECSSEKYEQEQLRYAEQDRERATRDIITGVGGLVLGLVFFAGAGGTAGYAIVKKRRSAGS